jgi:hypothetical protein
MPSSHRRPMSAALKTVDLNSEALAFIKEGTPKPLVEQSATVPMALKTELALVSEETLDDEPVEEPPKPTRTRATAPKAETFVAVPGLVFTSLRLPAEIPHALMRASFDRKLKREKPWTQQDIAAEALSFWLKKHGYL